MAYSRQIAVTNLEDIDAALVKALQCLRPVIVYQEQHNQTAASAQQLRNLRDLERALMAAQKQITRNLPERRR